MRDSAEAVLSAARPYGGNVAEYYRHISGTAFKATTTFVEILAVCSRLRVGFKTQWLNTWAPRQTVQAFRQQLHHLFREHVDGWRFFHDSFRQFAADRTALGDDGRPDDAENAAAHQRVAELCAESNDHAVAAEELYHRLCAGQHSSALLLAQQAAFRAQRYQLRSAELIRADIESALSVAAEHAEVEAMLQLILALFELDEHGRSLEEIDVVGLLHDVGLVQEAVTYCGDARGVSFAHAYRLAADLAASGDPSGRRIFDLLDPGGLTWEDNAFPPEEGNEAATGLGESSLLVSAVGLRAARGPGPRRGSPPRRPSRQLRIRALDPIWTGHASPDRRCRPRPRRRRDRRDLLCSARVGPAGTR